MIYTFMIFMVVNFYWYVYYLENICTHLLSDSWLSASDFKSITRVLPKSKKKTIYNHKSKFQLMFSISLTQTIFGQWFCVQTFVQWHCSIGRDFNAVNLRSHQTIRFAVCVNEHIFILKQYKHNNKYIKYKNKNYITFTWQVMAFQHCI